MLRLLPLVFPSEKRFVASENNQQFSAVGFQTVSLGVKCERYM